MIKIWNLFPKIVYDFATLFKFEKIYSKFYLLFLYYSSNQMWINKIK